MTDRRPVLRVLGLVETLLSWPAAPSAEEIAWTLVGHLGNACDPDPLTEVCFGGVDEYYLIGTHEVTNAQYVEFLDAVATSDPYGLYNPAMDPAHSYPDPQGDGEPSGPVSRFGGIVRTGTDGSFEYNVIAGRENLPVNHVSFYDALRFVNWLHNGKGNGDTETGAYDLAGGLPTPANGPLVSRNPEARFFLPNEDEWYKAAYYHGPSQSYRAHPTGSDSAPACGPPTAAVNHANCDAAFGDLSEVGSYSGSPSPFGTLDQAGNVLEWTEALLFEGGAPRILRGGSFFVPAGVSAASARTGTNADAEGSVVGFRVAPEPGGSAPLLAGLGVLRLIHRRRRAHCDTRLG